MIDIRDKDHKSLCDIANECFTTAIEIWAYGSRVNGESHDASDLDIVIRTVDFTPLAINEFIDFKEQLQASNIPIIIQVMDWNRIPKSFHGNILKNHKVIYSSL